MKKISLILFSLILTTQISASAESKSKIRTMGNLTSVIFLDASIATTYNLPQASFSVGQIYEFKKTDSSFTAISIVAYPSEQIDGNSTTSLATKGEDLRIISDGTKWTILNRSANTEWSTYTPTLTHDSGGITNYSSTAKWRRVGDSIEVEGLITFSGTSASFNSLIASLPSGLSADTSKLTSSSLDMVLVGSMKALDAGHIHFIGGATYYRSSTTVYLQPASISSHSGTAPVEGAVMTEAFPFTFDSNDTISYNFKLPISGWK